MKILIVDDDEIARMSLSNILGGLGAIVEAEDGELAWRLLEDGLRPSLCCCDVVMPNLDGLGLLQRTREHPIFRDMPMVLISSASDRQTVQTAIAGGVAGYILKPFLAVQTRATVDRVLREKRAAQAEPVLVTRRRLGVDMEQLHKLLHKLVNDVAQFDRAQAEPVPGSATPADGPAAAAAWLQRLHSGAVVLGLWRAATLLKGALDDSSSLRERQLVVREVARLVDEQLREARQQAQAAA
jgi:two-component system chemotaxis response regulator CheY